MSMVKVSVAGCVACVPCARSVSMRWASRVCVVKRSVTTGSGGVRLVTESCDSPARENHGCSCLGRGAHVLPPPASRGLGVRGFTAHPKLGLCYVVNIGCCAAGALRVTVLARPSGHWRRFASPGWGL